MSVPGNSVLRCTDLVFSANPSLIGNWSPETTQNVLPLLSKKSELVEVSSRGVCFLLLPEIPVSFASIKPIDSKFANPVENWFYGTL